MDALQALHDARDILVGLAKDVPKEYAKPLASIQANADEAIDAVEEGVARLSQVPHPSEEDV